MLPVVISIVIIGGVCVFLASRNVKLKAMNTKLEVENKNLQYELGSALVREKENNISKEDDLIAGDRIKAMKEKFKSLETVKKNAKKNRVTEDDVNKFYENQRVQTLNERKLKK